MGNNLAAISKLRYDSDLKFVPQSVKLYNHGEGPYLGALRRRPNFTSSYRGVNACLA